MSSNKNGPREQYASTWIAQVEENNADDIKKSMVYFPF